ncbi:hypothetical protein RCL_jg13415.t1 [Rhizophagus clarus]|uniref:Uncharacterized protein n=1 Tax=Rhizophagus clarus TaxID=94130 RepID=A0A8H3LR17_9GLOM|nr:hypothetical protein RCL_jg13415.t1 [Rhizophagus clarus]
MKLSIKRNKRYKSVHCTVKLSSDNEKYLDQVCGDHAGFLEKGFYKCIAQIFPGHMSVKEIQAETQEALFMLREFTSPQRKGNSVNQLWSIRIKYTLRSACEVTLKGRRYLLAEFKNFNSPWKRKEDMEFSKTLTTKSTVKPKKTDDKRKKKKDLNIFIQDHEIAELTFEEWDNL